MNNLTVDPKNLLNNNKITAMKNSISKTSDNEKLKESCEEFEAMFIKQMLSSMKNTVTKSGFIKENMGEKIFDDMLTDEYAKSMSKTSGFGIAQMMYKQLSVNKYQ